jgi:hypothetical protein
LEPLVNLDFALEPLDVSNLDAGVVGFNLPLAFRDAIKFEDNPRGFGHRTEYAPLGPAGKPCGEPWARFISPRESSPAGRIDGCGIQFPCPDARKFGENRSVFPPVATLL